MKTIFYLLAPRFYSALNSLRLDNKRNNWLRIIIYGLIGLFFWIGAFIIFYKVLFYFQNVEDFGNILAMKLLSMIIITFVALLIFSNIVNCLSHLYLSQDLALIHSLPVSGKDIFFSRWIISTFDSSWMVVAFSLPVFLSYGIIYKAGIFYYLIILLAILFMSLITSAVSSILVLFCAMVLPAGRIRTILVMLGFVLVLILILVLRMTRPEQLVNPDSFASAVLYLNSLQTPNSPILPTTWLMDAVKSALSSEYGVSLLNIALAGSFAFMIIFFAETIAGITYFKGYSKSQTTPRRLFSPVKYKGVNWETLLNFLPREAKAFAIKEIRTFFRDSTQWPQLFLMGALIVIYLFNFSVLPWDKSPIKAVYLQNLFSFLNMGLASFVLSAMAARFVYPAVSLEGAAFWIVQAAPVSLKTFLWIKFFLYYFPLLIMVEILIVVSNILLQVSSFMMILSVITIFFLVPAVVGMGVGLGAIYPNFKSENPAQIVTSFGGLLFMIFCFALIAIVIILEAGPTYYVFMANIKNKPLVMWQIIWLASSLVIVCSLCFFAIFYPMRLGERSLDKKSRV
jgi:ABC-2 type transport system permease protein